MMKHFLLIFTILSIANLIFCIDSDKLEKFDSSIFLGDESKISAERAGNLKDIINNSIKKNCPYLGFKGPTCISAPNSDFGTSIEEAMSGDNIVGDINLYGIVGVGFDVGSHELKLPAVAFTTSNKMKANGTLKYFTMNDVNGVSREFAIPQEIEITNRDPAQGIRKKKFYTTEREMNSIYNFDPSANQSGVGTGGLYSTKYTAQSLYNSFFTSERSVSLVTDKHSSAEVVFKKNTNPKADEYFKAAIDWLPENYNYDDYAMLIKYYGTHFTYDASIGGVMEQQNQIAECLYSSKQVSGADLEAYANMDYEYAFSHNGGNSPKIYQNSRKVGSVDIIGGNPEIVKWEKWADRIQSFKTNPVQVNFIYKPISDLVTHKGKKMNLIKAIVQYLTSVKRSMNSAEYNANQNRQNLYKKVRKITYGGQTEKSIKFKNTPDYNEDDYGIIPHEKALAPTLIDRDTIGFFKEGDEYNFSQMRKASDKCDDCDYEYQSPDELRIREELEQMSYLTPEGDSVEDSWGFFRICQCPKGKYMGVANLKADEWFSFKPAFLEFPPNSTLGGFENEGTVDVLKKDKYWYYCIRDKAGYLRFQAQKNSDIIALGKSVLMGCSSSGIQNKDGTFEAGLICCHSSILDTVTSKCTDGNKPDCKSRDGTRARMSCPSL